MTIDCLNTSECGDMAAYLTGAFDLTLQRTDQEPRNIGNVVIGTMQDEVETFYGCPADGSDPDGVTAYQIRHAFNLIVSADEITCENLRAWLETPVTNIPGGQRLSLEMILEKSPFRAVATQTLCDGTDISIVLHRVFITTPLDLLFQSGAITGNQFTLRAVRDYAYPTNPFGYIDVTDGGCSTS